MQKSQFFLVIIAGGSGTRFWPKSTSKKPKQLLSFDRSSQSLLKQTLARFEDWIPSSQTLIVTTQSLAEAVATEAPGITVLAEPQGKNTAPCLYWAAQYLYQKDPQSVMIVMPSDHYIARPDTFLQVVKTASQWAIENNDLVTLGIRPTRPETGYGYLQTSSFLGSKESTVGVRRVNQFIEKPNLLKAKELLKEGNYLWNGGMFLWQTKVLLQAFDEFMPEMKRAWEQHDGIVERAYPAMTATSIDFGIMEKAKNVVTFPLDCGWDDLGSWTSLEGLAPTLHTHEGDNIVTAGQLLPLDSRANIIDAPNRLVALLGINDLIIVEQGEAILIARKDRAQEIRNLVEEVKKKRPDLT